MGTLLNGRERFLFDERNKEVLRLAGVKECILWKLIPYPTPEIVAALPNGGLPWIPASSVSGQSVDCLYGEPLAGTKHYFPFNVLGYFEEPTLTDTATDPGSDYVFEGRMWFNRKDLEEKKVPREPINHDWMQVGDIAQIFRRGRFLFLEVKSVQRTGFVNDSEVFTQYVCDVVRNDSFTPERKIAGDV